MKWLLFCSALWLGAAGAATPKPNVLLIAVDDLNDWVGCLGGNPAARTPHLDALARRGTLFANAHCQAPICAASRSSVLTSRRPSSTGLYGLAPAHHKVPELRDVPTLFSHFKASGYRTLTVGKIYHELPSDPAQRAREIDVAGPPSGARAVPPEKLIGPTPMGNHPWMDWGTFPHQDEDRSDWQTATWAIQQLKTLSPNQPFLLATGFFLPHVPCYVPPAWLAAVPDDDSVLPPTLEDDRADVPSFAWHLHWRLPEPRLPWLKAQHQWRNLCRSYLACTTFADAQIGRLLDSLAASPHAGTTIVVLWSDHGWHLGEKGITGKNSLWERSTHVPFFIFRPAGTGGGRVVEPVELLDIFPTLADLCGLGSVPGLEGVSLRPWLEHPSAVGHRPALTTSNPGNHSLRTRTERYIRYADGSTEFYDHTRDPNEWKNLAHDPATADRRRELDAHFPRQEVPHIPGSAGRTLTWDATTRTATWEGNPITPGTPIPE